MNEETKFATRCFDIEASALTDDARCVLKEIELDEVLAISPNATRNMALDKVTSSKKTESFMLSIAKKLVGVISTSDLLELRILTKEKKEELLRKTDINLFVGDCEGTILNVSDITSSGKVFVFDAENKNNDYEKSLLLLFRCIYENPVAIIYSGINEDQKIINECINRNISLVQTKMSIEEILESLDVQLMFQK